MAGSPWDRWPRGTPLEPPYWYRPPVVPPPLPDGRRAFPAQQGDIYRNVPHVGLTTRPVKYLVDQSAANKRQPYLVTNEDQDDIPLGRAGTNMVVEGERGLGILLTQDCELDKAKPTLIFARIRFVTPGTELQHLQRIRERRVYRSFFLPASEQDFRLPASIVDFGRLTTLLPSAVRHDDRVLSLHDDVRDCLRRDFTAFLMAEREG